MRSLWFVDCCMLCLSCCLLSVDCYCNAFVVVGCSFCVVCRLLVVGWRLLFVVGCALCSVYCLLMC